MGSDDEDAGKNAKIKAARDVVESPGAKRRRSFKDHTEKHAVSLEQVRAKASLDEGKAMDLEASTAKNEMEGDLKAILASVHTHFRTLVHNEIKASGYNQTEGILYEVVLNALADISAAFPEGERDALMGPLNGVVGRLLAVLEKREGMNTDGKSFMELAFFNRDAAFIDLSHTARLDMACGLMKNRKAVDWVGESTLSSEELREAKALGSKASKTAADAQKAKGSPKGKASGSPRKGGGGQGGGAKVAQGDQCHKCKKYG